MRGCQGEHQKPRWGLESLLADGSLQGAGPHPTMRQVRADRWRQCGPRALHASRLVRQLTRHDGLYALLSANESSNEQPSDNNCLIIACYSDFAGPNCPGSIELLSSWRPRSVRIASLVNEETTLSPLDC